MQKLKLGVSISLSGRYSLQGKESFEGLKLWVRDVNQSSGIFVRKYDKKLPVKLIFYDDESTAERCQSLVEKLIVEDKVDILIGPYSSGLTRAAVPIAQDYKKILWNHGGSSDDITKEGYTNVISAITPASEYFTGIIELVRKIDPSARNVVIFKAEESGFSSNVSEGAKRCAEWNGFLIEEYSYQSGTKDFYLQLERVKETEPDLILGVGRTEDDLLLAKQIIEQKVNAKAIGLVVAAIKYFKERFGEKAEGFLSTSQWEKGIRIKPDFGPIPIEFSKRFKDEYGKEPDYLAAQGYNIGLVIQRCISEANTLDDQELRKAASKIDFRTFYGRFKIDPATGRQLGHRMVIVQWQGGEKFIVFPADLAEAEPLYPMPSTMNI